MFENDKPLGITDLALRDAHQSLFATRLRLEDMLPIAGKLDQIGFWSIESWGGATFDSCIRFLGEDPWERLREFKKAMPNTQQQMLLRGQNLLGYRHYADDVVDVFVERAVANGMDVFRVFDAMNDPRNLQQAMKAVKAQGAHAQGTISYTTSPVHNIGLWVDLAKHIEDMAADSLCIKDMAGILTPYDAYELVSRLKKETNLEIQMHCHATAGLSSMTLLKAIEAGVDRVDTAISSLSMTYGHSPTESIVAALQGTARDTGLNINALEEIAAYFRDIRKKYAKFEGALRGIDSRILVAQVPGGMLTNMEIQLKEQGAADKFDAVLKEIPRVREDLGYIPLVTPTSQIVGTQAVLNVLTGERYKTISKEAQGILKGEYGAAPAPFNCELQVKVLDGAEPITCRPADVLAPEIARLTDEVNAQVKEKGIRLAENAIDDVLTVTLFPQIGLKFLENRDNPDAFEAVSTGEALVVQASGKPEAYTVTVSGQTYVVEVAEGGDISGIKPVSIAGGGQAVLPVNGKPMPAPLAGNIWKVHAQLGQKIQEGDVLIILEAMKMETEIRAPFGGIVVAVSVKEGDSVVVGDTLLTLA